ncbi:MAG TPA: redoxin domain-containing protein [Fimbriimonas sp.]|nr:redoxin domain-containing protein [Fimbriimonas sp.]
MSAIPRPSFPYGAVDDSLKGIRRDGYTSAESMLSIAVAAIFLSRHAAARLDDEAGHSSHGSAFDSGMRSRPWLMKGIGVAPFPITTKNPEAQVWFNQGNALLHSFWFEEAERSFRWCLKLDPDCAMAYWGLARCGFTWFERGDGRLGDPRFDRYKAFLKEAVQRKSKVSEREKAYIEVWEKGFADDVPNRSHRLMELLKELSANYPDDIEAKALLALFSIGQLKAEETQKLVDQVLETNPMHPGAHHASIHNWDDVDPGKAIASCRLYGQAAPSAGHALHMPGHIYSKVGMWHEAAISMDSATRVELKYMNDRLALPFEDWDYAHNRNYLCDIQEQLGMLNSSLEGSRDLLASPRDRDVRGYEARAAHEGFKALLRALIKFERWEDLLKPGVVPWQDADDGERTRRPAVEVLALVGERRLQEARSRLGEANGGSSGLLYKVAEAKLLIGEGKRTEGLKELSEVAASDSFGGDPPDQPWPVARVLGDAYLECQDAPSAIKAYESALAREPNDAFSLAGLAKAYHAVGDDAKAELYADRMLYEWSDADPGLKWLSEVRALELGKKPVAETLAPERRYNPESLGRLGPSNWTPFRAPKLDVRDVDGKSVTLEDHRGKNVLLVFFLGDYCVHCLTQLDMIDKRIHEFDRENVSVLAVCSAPPSKNKESKALTGLHVAMLSDRNHENARRFASYDDFENLELHSTILIDKEGRVRWKRTGGDPFTDIDFLLQEVHRVNASTKSSTAVTDAFGTKAG